MTRRALILKTELTAKKKRQNEKRGKKRLKILLSSDDLDFDDEDNETGGIEAKTKEIKN